MDGKNEIGHPQLGGADQRMLDLLEHLQQSGRIRFRQDFLDAIGMPKQHFRGIMLGKRHFSSDQIARACIEYQVNANWIFGIEETMYRRTKRTTLAVSAQNGKTG